MRGGGFWRSATTTHSAIRCAASYRSICRRAAQCWTPAAARASIRRRSLRPRSKRTAGRHKGIDFAVASLFHIPCAAESVDVLTDVFAPIVPAEFHRVLKPGGTMILAVPGARHLYGMKEVLYDAPYENEEHGTDYEGFEFLGGESVRREITVEGAENIEALFSMTPYYWKTDVAGGERLRRLNTLETEIKFRFLVYRRR